MLDHTADESTLERFVAALPGIVYRSDPAPPRELTVVDGDAEALTGHAAADFLEGDVTLEQCVSDDALDPLETELADAVAARRQFTATYDVRTRSGERKRAFERGTPVVEGDEVVAIEGLVLDVTRLSNARLDRRDDLFAHTQELADVGGWALDPTADELRWTEGVKRIHGVSSESSPTPEDAISFYHPEDRPVLAGAVEAALESGESFDHELRIVTDAGDTRWVRVNGVPEVVDGETVYLRGALQDVTDRRERERSLRDEQAFRRGLYEALPDLLYAFDADGSLTRWNARLEAVTGYGEGEIETMEPLDFVADADRDRVLDHIARVFEDGESVRVNARLRTKAGEHIPYEFTGAPLREGNGRVRELVGVGRDVSQRLQRQRRFEAVFNNTYQFTGLLNPDGTVIEVNEAGLSFMEADREAIVGVELWEALEFVAPADRDSVRRGYERAVAGEPYRDELRVHGSDGEAVIEFSLRPITDANGDLQFLVPEGRDITDSKERERLVQVLHRLLRHNIRNDLTVIRGYADLLAESLTDDALIAHAETMDATAESLLATSEKAKQIVDMILYPSVDAESRNLGSVARAVAEDFRERYPAATVVTTVEDSVAVACTERIGTALEQLVENALEHNTAETPRADIRVFERDGDACLAVSDNGVGISPDEWSMVTEEVREEGSQVRHGSGMGLLLTQWIVDGCDGQLAYTTAETPGSTITVRLPAAETV